MPRSPCAPQFSLILRTLALALAALLCLAGASVPAVAQQTQGGSVAGKVTDERGTAVSGADVMIEGTSRTAQTGGTGEYLIEDVPAGSQVVRVRMIGFRSQADTVSVAEGGRATADISLTRDPLQLQTMVVTGTQTPRMNLDASVAVTTLRSQEVERAAPRSTTEMLRYVPGFTRVESSGGEVNQNISMRGHSRRRVRDVHGRRDAGVPHHAHLLHERRQPVPLRREHRADGGRAGRRLGAVRLQYAGRHHQLHQQDRRRSVRRHHAGHRRHRGARPLRPQRQRPAGRGLAVQRGRLLPLRPRRARPRVSRHTWRPAQGQRDPATSRTATSARRSSTSTTATSSSCRCRSPTPTIPQYVQRLQRLRRDQHATRASTSGCRPRPAS